MSRVGVAGLPAGAGAGGGSPDAPRGRSPILHGPTSSGVSHQDVDHAKTPVSALCDPLHPGADLLITPWRVRRAAGQAVEAGRAGGDACATCRPRPSGELDPTGAGDTFLAALQSSALRPAIAGRATVARSPRPSVRGGGGLAGRRGARPRRCPGPGGGQRPAGTRAGPTGGPSDRGGPGRGASSSRRLKGVPADRRQPAAQPATQADDASRRSASSRGSGPASLGVARWRRDPGGGQRTSRIAQPVLADLRQLDRGHHRGPPGPAASAARRRPPLPAPEPAEEVRPLDRRSAR